MKNPFPPRKTRLGFHYFPDTLHYREIDLQTWLPELQDLGVNWLVLKAPPERAIPEYFIGELVEAGIEPILDFDCALYDAPDAGSIETILNAYARWGVHSAIWFDRPNSRIAWPAYGWAQQDLVERFLDRYLPLANLSLNCGLVPVFPALEPGGAYWDTAFLRSALQSIARRRMNHLLENLAIAAYAWHWDRPLSWGAGGPHRWPDARPYVPVESGQDEFGFRIFEWYSSVVEAELGEPRPVLLLQAGMKGSGASDLEQSGDQSKTIQGNGIDDQRQGKIGLSIAKLLAGEEVNEPDDPTALVEDLPAEVICANLWLLACDENDPNRPYAWFQKAKNQPEGAPSFEEKPGARKMKTWYAGPRQKQAYQNEEEPFRKDLPQSKKNHTVVHHPIKSYLLLPVYEFGVADWHLNVIKPFVKKYRPTVGFSIEEAAMAEHVIVIGGPQSISEETVEKLREGGSIVERIQGDGTSIASILAER